MVRENLEGLHIGHEHDVRMDADANPAALLLAAAMMRDHCKLTELATRLRVAIDAAFNIDKMLTGDPGGSTSTAAFTQALVGRVKNG